MDEAGIKFLDKIFGELYMSDIVQHTKENSDKRTDAIRKYLERLERLHSFANTEQRKQYVLDMYFDKYVIKPENIDEKHIPDGETKESIIAKQKKGLSNWIDYLTDPSTPYPTWARYWAFQGVRKMGSYDESKKAYLKRSDKTLAGYPFPDPTALAKTMEVITKLVNDQEIDDLTQLRLSKTDSFSKIYTIFANQHKEQIIADSSVEGEWIKYDQGDREAAERLSQSLSKYDTKWCTASEGTAIKQVCGPYSDAPEGGDFYVYYTKDKNGNFKVPRIAIRCSGHDGIGEIRGVDSGQNLEIELDGVLEKKLKEMTFMKPEAIADAMQKIEGLRELTAIGIKIENGEKLTAKEALDLYTKRYGFGWAQDPRVEKFWKHEKIADVLDGNPEVLKTMLKEDVYLIKKLPPKIIENNPELFNIAIETYKFAPALFSPEVLGQHVDQVMECIVATKGQLAEELPKEFFASHPDVYIPALRLNPRAIRSASPEFLEGNAPLVSDILSKDGSVLISLPKEYISSHPEFFDASINSYSMTPAFFGDDVLEQHLEQVKSCIISSEGGLLSNLSSDFIRQHPDVLMETAKVGPINLESCRIPFEEIYTQYPDVIRIAAETMPSIIKDLPGQYLEEHQDVVVAAVKKDPYMLRTEVCSTGLVDRHPEIIQEAIKEQPAVLSELSDAYLEKNIPMVQDTIAKDPSSICYMRTSFMVEHPEFLIDSLNKVDTKDEKMQTFFTEKKETISTILSSKEEWKQYLPKVKVKEQKMDRPKPKKRNKVHNVNKKLKSNKLFNGLKEKIFKKKTTEKRKPVYKSDKTYRSSSSLMEMRQRINNKKNSKSGKTL